jgi:hypothetical protein
MNRSLVITLFLSLLNSVPLSSRGDDLLEEQAKAAFSRGKKLFEGMEYKASADAFREAYRLKSSWKLLYNIGQAEAAAKRFGLALEVFEKYLAEGGDEIPDERRKAVIGDVQQFRAMVGSIIVKAPDGAVIVVDGVNRGTAPLPGKLKVAAGIEHEVKIELENVSKEPQTVVVSGGDVAKVEFGDVEPEAEPSEPPASGVEEVEKAVEAEEVVEETDDDELSKLKLMGWIGVGVGGAMLIGGGSTGIATMSLNSELEDECVDGQCLPDSHEKLKKRDSLALASDILIWGGAAIAVAGATMLIIDAVSDEKPDDARAVVPTFGDQHAGLAFIGRF